MANKEFPLSVVIKAVDRATAPLKRVQDQINKTFRPQQFARLNKSMEMLGQAAGFSKIGGGIGRLNDSLSTFGNRMAVTTAGVTAGAVGMAVAFNNMFIGTASKFERFQTILETLEGSSAAAKSSMAWISDFAAKTPYEMDEVTDSFVKLRAYGMKPQAGLLKTLGDTSAAMGKNLNQAVEAIADAVTGENERLKEFGIKARTDGNKITYEYTVAGKTMTKTAKKNSREMIQATLEGIFNSKYAGAMDKLSKTWDGMVSNVSDQWTRFKNMIMQAGPFDWLKTKLDALLQTINRMAANGDLQRIATMIGQHIVTGLEKLYNVAVNDLVPALKSVWEFLKNLRDIFGSWKFLIYGVVAILGAPLITALAGVTTALVSLGVVMMTTPLGWFAAAVAGIVAAGYLLGTGINMLIERFKKLGAMKGFIEPLLTVIKAMVNPIGTLLSLMGKLPSFAKGIGATPVASGAPVPTGRPVNTAAATGLMQTRQTNDASVTLNIPNVPSGTRATSTGNAPLTLNLGPRMAY